MDHLLRRARYLEQALFEHHGLERPLREEEDPKQTQISDAFILYVTIRELLIGMHRLHRDKSPENSPASRVALANEFHRLAAIFVDTVEKLSKEQAGFPGKAILQAAGIWDQPISGLEHDSALGVKQKQVNMAETVKMESGLTESRAVALRGSLKNLGLCAGDDIDAFSTQANELFSLLEVLGFVKSMTKDNEVPADTKGKAKADEVPVAADLALGPCCVCFDEFAKISLSCAKAEHLYCIDCILAMFTTAFGDFSQKFPPSCCGRDLPLTLLQGVVSNDLMAQFDDKATEHRIEVAERVYCRTCACFIRPEDIQNKQAWCWRCRRSACALCRDHGHQGPCLEQDGEPALMDLAKKMHWQQCAKCKQIVEKAQGCNHMRCVNCGHAFCYVCGENYRNCGCPQFAADIIEDGFIVDRFGIPRPAPGPLPAGINRPPPLLRPNPNLRRVFADPLAQPQQPANQHDQEDEVNAAWPRVRARAGLDDVLARAGRPVAHADRIERNARHPIQERLDRLDHESEERRQRRELNPPGMAEPAGPFRAAAEAWPAPRANMRIQPAPRPRQRAMPALRRENAELADPAPARDNLARWNDEGGNRINLGDPLPAIGTAAQPPAAPRRPVEVRQAASRLTSAAQAAAPPLLQAPNARPRPSPLGPNPNPLNLDHQRRLTRLEALEQDDDYPTEAEMDALHESQRQFQNNTDQLAARLGRFLAGTYDDEAEDGFFGEGPADTMTQIHRHLEVADRLQARHEDIIRRLQDDDDDETVAGGRANRPGPGNSLQ